MLIILKFWGENLIRLLWFIAMWYENGNKANKNATT